MYRSPSKNSLNDLQIEISLAKMSTKREKNYKATKLNEIVSAVCALFNSGGGNLDLILDTDFKKQVNDSVRMIEQCLSKIVPITETALHIKSPVNSHVITIEVQDTGTFVSVKYNMYWSRECQVEAIPATTPSDQVKRILQRTAVQNSVQVGSHIKNFVKDANSDLQESSVLQLKYLKASPSKCVTLADRMVGKSNKLKSYLSAFANHRGGHVYYGIDDEGIVKGEEITDKGQEEIIKKVTNTVNKMVWTTARQKLRRGEHWDIFFEAVQDTNGKPIPSSYVIVVYISPCPGGMFTEEPESYQLVHGMVKRMSFQDWRTKFNRGLKKHTQLVLVPPHVARVQWSSEKNGKVFRVLSEKLLQHRNDEDVSAFKRLSELAMARFSDSNAELIVKAEQIVVAYKHYQFKRAESELESFRELLSSSNDRFIFETRLLLLKSVIERTKGNYEKSYEIIEQGLQMVQEIPVELYTVWFYTAAAIVTTIISTQQQDVQRNRSLQEKALKYLKLAERGALSLEDPPSTTSDLQQKLRICRAWVFLDTAKSGEVVHQSYGTNGEDTEAAAGELLSVSESVFRGNPLSHFRNVEYHLAQCDLLRRCSEVPEQDCISNLKQAFEFASIARDLARKHHFENMVDYANKRLGDLTERLIRNALNRRRRDVTNTFFGLEY